jgi:hypothetical protein
MKMEDYPKDTPRTNAFEETCGDYEKPHTYARRLAVFARELELEAAEKQARIDALMLEYCPDEMTPEQVEEWGRHQRAKHNDKLRSE